jgi:hypothetical protein
MEGENKCPFCSGFDHFNAALSSKFKSFHPTSIRTRLDVPTTFSKRLDIWTTISKERDDGKFATTTVLAQERGKYLLDAVSVPFHEEIAKSNKYEGPGFTVSVLGLKQRKQPPTPPPPFFFVDKLYRSGKLANYVLYHACRITVDKSPIEVEVHWWPDHGHIITVRSFPVNKATAEDFELLKEAINLFRFSETRGKKETINDGSIEAAILTLRRQGVTITRKAVALQLDCNYDTLRKWLKRHPKFMVRWKELSSGNIPAE